MIADAAVSGLARKQFPAAAIARVTRTPSPGRARSSSATAFTFAAVLLLLVCLALPGEAQSLNWEGIGGGVVTPFANPAGNGGLVRPTVAFHFLNGGDIVGRRYQASVTLGIGDRVEVGYTRSSVTSSDAYERLLFDRGFNTFHGKVNLVPEGSGGAPAIAVGALWRWQAQHIENGLGVATKDADIYLVATRTLPLVPGLALLLNGGGRVSNASLLGIAGNAPGWQLLGFAAGGVRLGTDLTFIAEYLQEPSEIDGMPGAKLPATLTGFARWRPEQGGFGIDVGVLRAAGEIMSGFDAAAERQLVAGVSYSF